MKIFIKDKNRFLLENHPTLWNTKILWMLSVSLVLHVLFYLFGILSVTNPESLQEYRVINNFFGNGVILLSIIISVLLLVVWMIAMFRNNAFKNFYPFTRVKLFKHFMSYFVIFMATTTFYYSFTLGMQTYVSISYNDERMERDIERINKAMPLLPFELLSYEVDRLRLPTPFDKLYCETNSYEFDKNAVSYEFKGNSYQFYTLRKTFIPNNRYTEYDDRERQIFNEIIDGKQYYYYKDQVYTGNLPLGTAAPSFYNFSDVFYTPDDDTPYYTEGLYTNSVGNPTFNQLTPERRIQIKVNQNLLARGKTAIEEELNELLKITAAYKIKHNLKLDEWLKKQSYASPYTIEELIKDGKWKYKRSSFNDDNRSEFARYEESLRKNLYFDASALQASLKNIHELKTTNIFEGSIHAFLWLAFAFSVIVFMFRVTGLKPLLFSIVAVGLLSILVSLITVFIGYLLSFGGSIEYIPFILSLLLGAGILILTLVYYNRFRKLISGILINITMMGIVPYLVLIVAFISSIQEDLCPYSYENDRRQDCNILWDILEVYWSYLFLVLGLVFMYWFCKRLMAWRALPEG
jgi:MFS family permease